MAFFATAFLYDFTSFLPSLVCPLEAYPSLSSPGTMRVCARELLGCSGESGEARHRPHQAFKDPTDQAEMQVFCFFPLGPQRHKSPLPSMTAHLRLCKATTLRYYLKFRSRGLFEAEEEVNHVPIALLSFRRVSADKDGAGLDVGMQRWLHQRWDSPCAGITSNPISFYLC